MTDITTAFTPYASLIGGCLIGLSALLLMLTTGRIAGVSGIVSRLLPPGSLASSNGVSLMFVAGMLCAAPLYMVSTGTTPDVSILSSKPVLVIGGLLVGFGSVIGNGCTSGHGVCGISRLSMRSIVATASFMLSAGITVYVVRHIVGGAG